MKSPGSERAHPNLNRRKVLAGTAFVTTAIAATVLQPHKRIDLLGTRKLADLVPANLDPWRYITASGLVVPPDDQLANLLYSQLLTRVYADGTGPPIMLLIAQSASQTGLLQVHRPEICYPAGGYTLSPTVQRPVQLDGRKLVVNQLTATADNVSEHILYWTRVGRHMPTTWREQRVAIAGDNLLGYIPDAVMVRVSIISQDRAAAMGPLERFIRRFAQAIDPRAHQVFFA